MISAFADGFAELAKKPLLLAVALIGTAINVGVMILASDSYMNVFVNMMVLGEVPEATVMEMPFFIFTSYAADIAVILVAMTTSLAAGFFTLFAYSRMVASKKTGLREGLSFATSKITEALFLSIFYMAALFLFALSAFLLFAAGVSFEGVEAITFLLFIALCAFGIYCYVKLFFTPLFMALEGMKLKKALAESWRWTAGKFIPLLFFLIIAWAVTAMVSGIAFAASDAIAVDEVSAAVAIIGFCIAGAYYSIVLVKFFSGLRH